MPLVRYIQYMMAQAGRLIHGPGAGRPRDGTWRVGSTWV